MALTRRQRARAWRGAQYALAVVIVVVLALTADWGQIGRQFFDLQAAAALFPDVVVIALRNTIVFTALGFLLALVLGLVLALMRLSSVAVYRWVAGAYVEFFRGLPALLIVIAIGFGIPLAFQLRLDRTLAITVALGVVGSAYICETIRAGIQSVPRGQVEAARSLGMSPARTMVTIVIPQAFRTVLPPLTNELILLTKDSSLVYVIGLSLSDSELTDFGRRYLTQNVNMTPLFAAALVYLMITVPLSIVVRRMEARAERAR